MLEGLLTACISQNAQRRSGQPLTAKAVACRVFGANGAGAVLTASMSSTVQRGRQGHQLSSAHVLKLAEVRDVSQPQQLHKCLEGPRWKFLSASKSQVHIVLQFLNIPVAMGKLRG